MGKSNNKEKRQVVWWSKKDKIKNNPADEIRDPSIKTTQDVLNEAAELAMKFPAYSGKSAQQHAMDIAQAIKGIEI